MIKVYNSDGTVSFTGYEDDVFKFLICMCNIKMDDLRYFDFYDSSSLWSDVYGTMNIENVGCV
jgi:hypothetical protein